MAEKKEKGKIIGEFKKFVTRGNVVDLAVGIIIGGAFTSIVSSLVNDIVMPFVGWLIGGLNFKDYKLVLSPAVGDLPESAITYGAFIQNIVNFLIIAIVVFFMVKAINHFRKKEEKAPAEPPKPSEEVQLLTEIRDLMKK